MTAKELKYQKFEKVFRVVTLLVVLSIFFIIQLPLQPQPDRLTIYLVVLITFPTVFLLRKVKIQVSNTTKDFIESVLMAGAISIIVHSSGGIRSYFLFLYLFPTLRISASSSIWHTLAMWLYTSSLIFGEVLLFPQTEVQAKLGFISSPINLAVLFSWSIGVISGFGRYLEAQLQKAQSAATLTTLEKEKSINKLKDEFLFIISHELRGPVTAIRGYLELFITSSKNIKDQVKNSAALAFNEGDKLSDLIAELLDISRLEVGKLKLQNEKFEIYDQIESVVQKYSSEAEVKEIELSLKPKDKEIWAFADKDRLHLITKNLLENAIKYTPTRGKIWVWVEEKKDQAYVSVADNGKGVSPEELPHIFDRFHHPSKQNRDDEIKEKNIGLGLFLAKNLTEKMGGEISVESRQGKGSKFTFSIPTAS